MNTMNKTFRLPVFGPLKNFIITRLNLLKINKAKLPF